jgi:benzoate membrane transport protein
MVTVSGVGFFGIGAAFWALLVGIVVNHLISAPAAQAPPPQETPTPARP